MIEGKWFPQGAEIGLPISVREAVFGRGRDALDALAQQVVVYREGEAVGSARLWWSEGGFRLGDVGVLAGERGRGYGDLLVRLLLFKALTHGARTISLTAPPDTRAFFAKYGFAPDASAEGEMSIRATDVRLSHCGPGCDGCGA